MTLSRRALLKIAAAAIPAAMLGVAATDAAADGLEYGPSEAFSFDRLTDMARELSLAPHRAAADPAPSVLDRIGYSEHVEIYQRADSGLYPDPSGNGAITFFHLGNYFRRPVRVFRIDGDTAREVLYRKRYFTIPEGNPAREMPEDAGFAGFRIHGKNASISPDGRSPDWAAFLGASYFRSSGDLDQYGISARGIAIDTAAHDRPEEFPDFRAFWVQPLRSGYRVYALLDGPSLTGAYRFDIFREPSVVMEVEAKLFMRKDVRTLGMAPLTSMYWYSETERWNGKDWRPEVHDSDGLLMHTGTGQWIWRPLSNPRRVSESSFMDNNPRGFGLMQRDRDHGNYIDPVRFERRPSLWVEPIGIWGKGCIRLVELPTVKEYDDNIVAFFVPEKLPRQGTPLSFKYRLHWTGDDPLPDFIVATHAIRMTKPWDSGLGVTTRKVFVEFRSESFKNVPTEDLKGLASPSRGTIDGVDVVRDPDGDPTHIRLFFNLNSTDEEASDVTATVSLNGRQVTETVICQVWPRERASHANSRFALLGKWRTCPAAIVGDRNASQSSHRHFRAANDR